MKIQYFSDIHLEFGACDAPPTDADVIVAAGDIGVGLQGIEWLAQFAKPTIYVAGNHEYYGGDLIYTQIAIAEKAAAAQIFFLENETVEIDGVRFLGATLWTDYLDGDRDVIAQAQRQMNDYHQIRCASRQLTPEYLFDLNSESRLWLAHELDEPFAGKTVVVTHHAPTMRSWPHSGESNYRGSYCNQLDDFISSVAIDIWFHGHVHASVDYEHQQTRVACNPRGYTGYQHVEGFSLAKTVDL
ncbi:MAG: metallophosphoesterase [Proteobacteria bacterium]|nr:MAG: metallophosphoesterase [Pseudomonadota bacterium]